MAHGAVSPSCLREFILGLGSNCLIALEESIGPIEQGLAESLSAGLAQSSSAYTFFRAPSNNIGCLISKKRVRGDIRQKSWRAPSKLSNCILDWGYGLSVERRGKAHFFCAGDTVIGGGRILPYGKSIRRDRFKCVRKFNSMNCRNLRNGHGFKLSRGWARWF